MKVEIQMAKQPKTCLILNHPRKVRSDAVLKVLSEKRKDEIAEFARTRSLVKTLKWLKKSGIDTSMGALSTFLSEYRVSQRLMQIAAVVQVALFEKLKQDPRLTPELMQQLGQSFFSGLAITREDARVWDITQQIELKKEKLDLERQKHCDDVKDRRAKLKKGLKAPKKGGGIRAETLEQIERELKLM